MRKLKRTILRLALFFAIILFYYLFSARTAFIAAQNDVISIMSIEEIKEVINLDLNLSFLDSDLFSMLKVHGDIPINPQMEGRDNPFIPY